jgi:hypothetical protein
MPEIGLAIPLAEFYEGLTFEDHPVEDNDNDQTPPRADLFMALFAARLSPALREASPCGPSVTGVPKLSTARRCLSFVTHHLAIGDEARIRDRQFAARSHPSVDFSAAGLITLSSSNLRHAGPRSIATATSRPRPWRSNSASSRALSAAASRSSSHSSGRRPRSSASKANRAAPSAPARESFTPSGAPFSLGSRRRQTSR